MQRGSAQGARTTRTLPGHGPRGGAQAPIRITTAPVGQRQHQQQQIGRYLVSMGIRTACFVAAIFVDGPLQWVLIAAAVVLPYIAVVLANAGRETVRPTRTLVTPPQRPALERPGPAQEPVDGGDGRAAGPLRGESWEHVRPAASPADRPAGPRWTDRDAAPGREPVAPRG